MARHEQNRAAKGSQFWLQHLVNSQPDPINRALRKSIGATEADSIEWLSPLSDDAFAEYQDGEFLEKLGIRPEERSLETFWPKGGPVWDGLARTSRGDFVLVEAKSHISELNSECGATSQESLTRITQSMAEAAAFYGAKSSESWTRTFYQYANRLTHLYFLRELNQLPAWLVMVCFINDPDMHGPKSAFEWEKAIAQVHDHLGVDAKRLQPSLIHLFVNVNDLRG